MDLRDVSADLLARLVEASDETCHLGILEGERVLYLEKMESSHSLRMVSHIGSTSSLHSTGLGKAILAHLPSASIEAILAQPLERHTSNTITDPGLLWRELRTIQERGFAVDDGENEVGVRCIGAPVFDHLGQAMAAISVAGPVTRMTRERADALAPVLVAAAAELSQRLGYSGKRTGKVVADEGPRIMAELSPAL